MFILGGKLEYCEIEEKKVKSREREWEGTMLLMCVFLDVSLNFRDTLERK